MPWSQQWFESPHDANLTVHKKLPEGASEEGYGFVHGLREASGHIDGKYQRFHFCSHCGGWIEGWPNQYEVNNLSPHQLAGRRGTEYFCQRCGSEIGFMGLMS